MQTGIDIQLMARPGEVVYIGRFENSTKTGYRFSFDKFKGKELVSRMTAQSVTYDTTRNYHWTVRDYMIRDFDGMKEKDHFRQRKRHNHSNRTKRLPYIRQRLGNTHHSPAYRICGKTKDARCREHQII